MSSVEHFSLTTRIERSASDVFAWHARPGAFNRLCPPWEKVETEESSSGMQDGAVVTVRQKFGPCWLKWTVVHRDYVAGRQFRDVQIGGPFALWDHWHRFEPDGDNACRLTDEITYRLPGGKFGRVVGGRFVRREVSRLFAWRHATTKADVELASFETARVGRRILIAGGSGVIGRALEPFLRTQGHSVFRLVRRRPINAGEVYWNPGAGELDAAAIEGVDAIVNLSGENVAGGRWTESRRRAIFRSRVDATRTLVGAMQRLQRRPEVLVSASAVGYYGDRGDDLLTERSEIGTGFLPEVCLAWETHAEVARKAGVRTALMRFGVVLTPAGGALAKLLPVFRAGVGGPIGDGHQWMSWISIDDAVGGIYHALMRRDLDGPMNAVAPVPVTNREFASTLARVLRRPAVISVPGFGLRTIYGEMADATVLASERAVPERLLAGGYTFRHPELETALRHVLGR